MNSTIRQGVKASSIAAPKNKIVTLKADFLGAKTSVKSNGGGYTLNLTGNMSGKKFVGTGKVDPLKIDGFIGNPPDRCYICKRAVFTATSFNINGSTYGISGTKFIRK